MVFTSTSIKNFGLGLTLLLLLASCCNQPFNEGEAKVQAKCTPIRTLIAKNYRVGFMAKILENGGGAGIEKTGTELTREQADRQVDIDRICRAWVNHVYTDAEWAAFLRKQGTASLAELSKATSQKDRADYEAALNELAKTIAGIGRSSNVAPPKDEIASLVEDLKVRIENISKINPLELQSELLKSFLALDNRVIDSRSVTEKSMNETLIRLANLNEQIGIIKDELANFAATPKSKKEIPPSHDQDVTNTAIVYIGFEKGSYQLSNSALLDLRKKLDIYKRSNVVFNISGYTENRGPVEFNERLAFRRGAVIRDWLIDELAISSSKITVAGHVRPYVGELKLAGRRIAVVRILDIK